MAKVAASPTPAPCLPLPSSILLPYPESIKQQIYLSLVLFSRSQVHGTSVEPVLVIMAYCR